MPKSNDKSPLKSEAIENYIDIRVQDNVLMKADTGVMQPQVKGCQQPLKAGRSKTDSSVEPPEGLWPYTHLIPDFWLPEL